MTQHELIITFFTIIYGIFLTDLFLSFHKLIRDKKKVKWHWLPILAAWYLFLVILKNWWDVLLIEQTADTLNLYVFIAYGHLMLLLFLLVSNVLPDNVEETGVDLKKYYFDNHRYFWGLMLGVLILLVAIRLIKHMDNLALINPLNMLVTSGSFMVFLLILIISKKYWVHASILVLFVIENILEIIAKGYS